VGHGGLTAGVGTVVNWKNILDGVIDNAAWAVAGMPIKP